VPELVNPYQITAGRNHTCALDDSGIVCWGRNDSGQTNTPDLIIDYDGDGQLNDAFPLDFSEWADFDSDGIGNNADEDDDNDGVNDDVDAFPLNPSESLDTDLDGIGNNTDTDDDNDGVNDDDDAFPLDPADSIDTDNDGIGNNADQDDDNDGVLDESDAFPLQSQYSLDTDSDNMPNAWEILYGLNPNDPTDTASDYDNDGVVALQEYYEGTMPAPEIVQNLLSWDFDGNGTADALTDALMMLRYSFGFAGELVTNDAIADDSAMSSEEVLSNLNNAKDSLLTDIDGNGVVDALTDSLLLLRALFGFTDDALIADAIGENASRTSATDVAKYISDHMPN
jgi:hypothetical protein